ncbi:MAG: hypothetical protein PUF49_09845 [Firmicutes bacterium]|nr:hypothetical protein [Bacillota bacterium]
MDKNKASDKKPAMERQQIITWYTPEEHLPQKFIDVLVTFSAQFEYSSYQHALGIATYWPDKTWWINGLNPEESNTATIHAWANIEPYWGKKLKAMRGKR